MAKYHDQAKWDQDLHFEVASAARLHDRGCGDQKQSAIMLHATQKMSSAIAPKGRPRPKLELIINEDTNLKYHVKDGKMLFGTKQQIFQEHMGSGKARSASPFACPHRDCTWRFKRKADLQRHYSCVHKKQRTHGCVFCSRLFARKDSLRR